MAEPCRIIVIGGVACGPKAAARARRRDPNAHITLVERGRLLSYAGCGLPFYLGGLVEDTRRLMETPVGVLRDEAFFKNVKDIDVRTATLAEAIDREEKEVYFVHVDTGEREELAYDKLVLATGGLPVVLPIEGVDLNRVFRLNRCSELRLSVLAKR